MSSPTTPSTAEAELEVVTVALDSAVAAGDVVAVPMEKSEKNGAQAYELPAQVPRHLWRIHGRDYDLNDWVNQHPGGPTMIGMGRGIDCTKLFETYHTFNEPRKRLAKHDVGGADASPAVPECPSAFLVEVHAMIKEHFRGKPKGAHKWTCGHTTMMVLFFALEIVSIYFWLRGHWWATFTWPFAGWILMCNAAHEGSHHSASVNSNFNVFCLALGAPLFAVSTTWNIQHVVLHHQETNLVGRDVDLHHNPFARWHRELQHKIPGGRCAGLHNLFWHSIAFLVSSFMMTCVHPIKFIFVPFIQFACKGKLTGEAAYTLDHTAKEFRADRITHGLQCPVPPHEVAMMSGVGTYIEAKFLMDAPRFLFINIISWAMAIFVFTYGWFVYGWCFKGFWFTWGPFLQASIWFMCVTQVSHIQEEAQRPRVQAEQDFFKQQALSSLDYSDKNRLTTFMTGGLNLQSLHHVCPNVSCCHYVDLYPKFFAIAEKHNCAPSTASGGWIHALYKHWLYVYRLGQDYDFDVNPEM